MTERKKNTHDQPRLVPSAELPAYFRSRGIAYSAQDSVALGFGQGKDQYRLFSYPGPANDETMGLFCEWHTEDFFDVDSGPHVAIGLRGPTETEPHRGRGLAIGILANETRLPENPEQPIPLFRGCPDPPGGPAFFVEDFSRNDGLRPVKDWQLSPGRHLPQLQGNGTYRIDIHVSRSHVWALVWQVTQTRAGVEYRFLDQVACSDKGLGFAGAPCMQEAEDQGRGNAFIGQGFADPENKSWVDNIYLAHWKNPA
jgi:hypothetical protein